MSAPAGRCRRRAWARAEVSEAQGGRRPGGRVERGLGRRSPRWTEEAAWLPLEVPEGHGVFIEANDAPERKVYFEQVMRRTLWTSGSTAVHMPAADTFEVWTWSPDLTVGELWYGFGVEEDFSDGGWADIFEDWDIFAW